MDGTRSRSAEEVLDDHLRESQTGSIDDDLPRNYAKDVVNPLPARRVPRAQRDATAQALLMEDVAGARSNTAPNESRARSAFSSGRRGANTAP